MEDEVERFSVLRFTNEERSNTELAIAKEFLFTIFLNGQELATLLCSPGNLQYLAAGVIKHHSNLIDIDKRTEKV